MMYVGSAAYIQKDGKILVARRHPNHPHGGGGMWEVPSGRLEAGESLEQGLAREIMEETGLEIKILAPVSTWCVPGHMIGVVFACDYVSGQVRLTSEHTECKWIEPSELVEYMDKPSAVDNIERYLEWRKHYLKED
jgi:8-oxo-dGTP diphosphatase